MRGGSRSPQQIAFKKSSKSCIRPKLCFTERTFLFFICNSPTQILSLHQKKGQIFSAAFGGRAKFLTSTGLHESQIFTPVKSWKLQNLTPVNMFSGHWSQLFTIFQGVFLLRPLKFPFAPNLRPSKCWKCCKSWVCELVISPNFFIFPLKSWFCTKKKAKFFRPPSAAEVIFLHS